MKNNIADYPDFLNAIRNNRLVFLFGTGISLALSCGKSYNWWKWIYQGTLKIKDETVASALAESIKHDNSTNNMIRVVGEVIKRTKADGTYDSWMRETIETPAMENHVLSAVLKKLLIAQDIFATTNYDRLLESATGLQALSYEEPGIAYEMIDKQKSSAVLHLHGIYDSKSGIDNIVADKEQYDAIIGNEGAQFIQNILGTRTVVFVGCGQTTEDGNISRFIEFSEQHLHVKQTYFLLHDGSSMPKNLPDFVQPILYGDTFNELPAFLDDIAEERLRFKIESNPIINRSIYTNKTDAFGLSEYHFSQEKLNFCGRTVELARLNSFLETDSQFKWWAITGQGGAGKSRLALELLQRRKIDWYGFFLNHTAEKADVDCFVPFNDTIIVIDYVKGNEKQIAALVSLLIDKYRSVPYKLRILFLERDNLLLSGSWFSTLSDSLDFSHRAAFNNAEYNRNMISKEHRFLYLDDLDDGAVLELIGLICENKGLLKDPARDRRLKDDYSKKYEQLKFRPLFLQMYIEAWIDNGCIAIEYQNYKTLLEIVVHREQERFLQIFENDVSVVNALIILLIRASVSDGESMPELSRAYPKEWNTVRSFVTSHSLGGKQTDESLQTLFREAEHGFAQNDILRPLYPDLIKEFMFIYYLDDESAASLSAELWKTCPIEYNTFLSRCIVDFQNEPLLIKLVRDATEDYSNLNAMQVRWALLQDKIIHTTDEGGIFLKMVTDEHTYWSSVPVNRDNEAIVLRGLYYSVFQYFAWSLEKESRAAIEQVIQFSCSEELKPIKATYLTEFIHYLVDRKSIPFAEQFVRPTSKLIEEIKDKKCRNECRLTLQREIMVCLAYRKELGKARQLHCKIKKKIDWSVEKQVEQYAYICFSGANQCYRKMQWKDMLTFADWIQDLAEECGKGRKRIYFNDKTHYYYLHSKLMRAETVTINAFLKDVGYYGIQLIDSLIDEIESNEMFSDLSGLLIGAKTLKIGFDESVSDAEARDVLSEADALLQKYPNNALLVAKSIDLWKAAYEFQFHKDVPTELVERAYALVLRFPSDEDVLFEFFEMLKKSSEASNWLKYTKNKAVVCGLIQHGMTEHLIPR